MKSFLILVLLINFAYLAWHEGWVINRVGTDTAEVRLGFQSAGQTLVLLSELSPERRDLMASLGQARSARAGAEQELQATQQQAAAVISAIGDVTDRIAENRAQSAQVVQSLVDAESVATAGEDLVLPPISDITPWCATTGTFAEQAAAAAFRDGLGQLGVQGALKVREEPISSTWWVHIPAFESEAVAMEVLAELQAKNIDSYYMRSGEMAGGISLGVFSRSESALIAQQQLSERGYTTTIREVARMEERPYVTLVMPDNALRQAPEWTAFLARTEGVEVTEKACETIASENEFP